MSDHGFVLRGRAVRQALDALLADLQRRHPDRPVTRSGLARELLLDAIARRIRRKDPDIT